MYYFYRERGRIQLVNNNISSSIIMANWPSTGNSLDTLTSEQMKLVSK